MNIEEIAKKYTRSEFLILPLHEIEKITEGKNCPDSHGLNSYYGDECKPYKRCYECWREAIKHIKFKDEEVAEGEKVEEVIKVRCKSNGFDFAKDETYKAERTITGAYKLMNDKGIYHIFFGTDFSNYFEKVTGDVLMVECIDNKNKESGLTIGKKYEVKQETPMEYWVINDNGEKWDYLKTRFKPVEPPKEEKKEYTAIEVLGLKDGEKYKSEFREISREGSMITIRDTKGQSVIINLDAKFTKVEEPKPVSFIEAWKALEEGKETESTYTLDRYKKENGLLVIQGKGFNNYCKCGSITASELMNSWIIL